MGIAYSISMLDRKKGLRRIKGTGPKPLPFETWASRLGIPFRLVPSGPWHVVPPPAHDPDAGSREP